MTGSGHSACRLSGDEDQALRRASVTGKRALDKSREEIKALSKASKKSFSVADNLANFLRAPKTITCSFNGRQGQASWDVIEPSPSDDSDLYVVNVTLGDYHALMRLPAFTEQSVIKALEGRSYLTH